MRQDTAPTRIFAGESRQPVGNWIQLHEVLRITTRRSVQFVDLTTRLATLVSRANLRLGVVNVQTRHTTTGLAINEHEPLLLTDLKDALERYSPTRARYRHDDLHERRNVVPLEPQNGHAHCKALVLRASESIHVVEGSLFLGRWQRVFLIELDGGREREVSVLLTGSTAGL